jgi:hypothetical protein
MGQHARLRKALAAKRGHAAAAAGAVALALAALPAAADAGAAWSKDWAEHQLRKHFRAGAAVCLPIGKASKQDGSSVFHEFVCVVVMRDGTRFSIHLKPRSRVAWTTVGIERDDAGAPPDTQPPNGHGQGHETGTAAARPARGA